MIRTISRTTLGYRCQALLGPTTRTGSLRRYRSTPRVSDPRRAEPALLLSLCYVTFSLVAPRSTHRIPHKRPLWNFHLVKHSCQTTNSHQLPFRTTYAENITVYTKTKKYGTGARKTSVHDARTGRALSIFVQRGGFKRRHVCENICTVPDLPTWTHVQ